MLRARMENSQNNIMSFSHERIFFLFNNNINNSLLFLKNSRVCHFSFIFFYFTSKVYLSDLCKIYASLDREMMGEQFEALNLL